MTLRSIHWIAESGLLVGLTTMGEFGQTPALTALSLSSSNLTLGVPASGAILGATAGSTITASGLPAGLTLNLSPGWAYDGTGTIGTYTILLTETLSGQSNPARTTSIAVSISFSAGAMLDFSQSANSGLLAAMRSF
jgi:hypothetical protein